MRWHQWPIRVYRWNESLLRRVAFRLLAVLALLTVVAAGGGLGAVLASALGQSREAGFWAGLTITVVGVFVAVLAVLTAGRDGPVRDWLERRG